MDGVAVGGRRGRELRIAEDDKMCLQMCRMWPFRCRSGNSRYLLRNRST